MCVTKDKIIAALKASGMEENEAIAAQLEIGKISLVGCTTYRDETNNALVEIFNKNIGKDPESARRCANAITDIMLAERSARQSTDMVAQRFYQRLSRAKSVARGW